MCVSLGTVLQIEGVFVCVCVCVYLCVCVPGDCGPDRGLVFVHVCPWGLRSRQGMRVCVSVCVSMGTVVQTEDVFVFVCVRVSGDCGPERGRQCMCVSLGTVVQTEGVSVCVCSWGLWSRQWTCMRGSLA